MDEQVGQIFMVGNPVGSVSHQLSGWATRHHVGNVMLTGRSTASVGQIADLTSDLGRLTTVSGIRPFIATDQEGGNVQVLKGPGFDRMPSALVQGGWSPARLIGRAGAWARQLKAAGVNMNLAPVADTAAAGANNPPVGDLRREFGHTPQAAGQGAAAFARGQLAQGVAVSVKHFPGLGSVTTNTDFSARVVDSVTTRNSPSIQAFRQVIDAGVPFVMVSSATYQKIDPDHLAVFSPTVLTWLRQGLGFSGAVITDDLSGAKAPQVLPAGQRAVTAIAAGSDLLLLSAQPQVLPKMWQAVHDRATSDTGFREQLSQAATRVIAAKQRMGLVTCDF
ncbi:beta-N-acetylhexosaminidase [Branchiibius hedensis]|uniref:beta-N-acetylhexosaminidase n=1 Tax=Branchiibius hedensis TaxID=672460 RepID=A0A2Y8ZQ30_9MICO|nr:glycoside hydrolase family 3 N-terminal domain-containing protein [Branchiibius hedensis]PWJ25221.1 beta-N-acetylhexosaminidase [Branchiibius hedensis]SSA34035.1 beta-N-acetylhexosaminidase [Branchiibius hedensis]